MAGNVSSQFVGGLLFALSLTEGTSTLTLTETIESAPYIRMTLDVLRLFGVDVTVTPDNRVYAIVGQQDLKSPGDVVVEADWSNAAFWLAAGAIGTEPITLTGITSVSSQGDRAVLDILRQFGAAVTEDKAARTITVAPKPLKAQTIDAAQIPDLVPILSIVAACAEGTTTFVNEDKAARTITVAPKPLKAQTIDAAQIPDLVPILSIVAACAEGTTTFVNAGRLRIKESDRLETTAAMLRAIGVTVEERPEGLVVTGQPKFTEGTVSGANDHRIVMSAAVAALRSEGSVTILVEERPEGLVVTGQPKFTEGTVSGANDHRIVMSAAVAALRSEGSVTIFGAQAVRKSYPHFFDDFARLGGVVSLEQDA